MRPPGRTSHLDRGANHPKAGLFGCSRLYSQIPLGKPYFKIINNKNLLFCHQCFIPRDREGAWEGRSATETQNRRSKLLVASQSR
ncbi:MAG: hypothetical protein D6680_19640 [Cyanobacteria bacterium J007]|nr:MAG: hypothetical protein D6680_19640 [Cyanobacteria bacterium J007]